MNNDIKIDESEKTHCDASRPHHLECSTSMKGGGMGGLG